MNRKSAQVVPAENFMATIAINVDNKNLSDKDFREFIRNTLPIVVYPENKNIVSVKKDELIKKAGLIVAEELGVEV
jgi:hypothetical protein